MGAAAINPTERFFQPEVSKVIFVPAIASSALAYTRVEVDAGDDLTAEIADLSGWTVESGFIATPDMGKRYTGKIGGRLTTPDSSITFYGDKSGDDVRSVLPRGTKGFVVFMDGGDVATQPSDVFAVEVASVGKMRSTGDNAFQVTVAFSISNFAEDVAIPA
jgi:hypothetical protein